MAIETLRLVGRKLLSNITVAVLVFLAAVIVFLAAVIVFLAAVIGAWALGPGPRALLDL